jgi:quercetin dioxygenase-like cupin family protein
MDSLAILPDTPSRAQIVRLEDELRSMPQLEVPTHHTFGPGFYVRTIELPAGATLTGRVHKTEHVFLLSKGRLTVVTEDGRQTLEAPAQFVCRPGLKRAGYAHTDVVCSNVHLTTETDLAKLEAALVEPEPLLANEAREALA